MNRGCAGALILAGLLWCTGGHPLAKTPPDGALTFRIPARSSERHEFAQVHMGLPVRIVVYAGGEDLARAAAAAAFARIAALDRVMSDYRPDSELRRLEGHSGRWTAVSPELFDILHRAVDLARATDGAFDPTVGPFVALWRDARARGRLPTEAAVAAARAAVGWWHLEFREPEHSEPGAAGPDRQAAVAVSALLVRPSRGPRASTGQVRLRLPGMRLDLGGIAKGYILQEACRVLRDHGTPRAFVEAGGDLAAGDPPPGRAGWSIETPGSDPAFGARASSLANAALATSGPSFQFLQIDGVRYSHIVDPRTGRGVTSPVVARVIGADGATADALATALTVMDASRARAVLARFPDVMASLGVDFRPASNLD